MLKVERRRQLPAREAEDRAREPHHPQQQAGRAVEEQRRDRAAFGRALDHLHRAILHLRSRVARLAGGPRKIADGRRQPRAQSARGRVAIHS